MRATLLLLLLAGCSWQPVSALGGAELASVAVFGRGLADIGVSAISGRDCSVVRLDRGQTYCAPRNDVLPPQPFCTRSLGTVDCWSQPDALPTRQREVGDTPPPTLTQENYRHARWPKSLNAGW